MWSVASACRHRTVAFHQMRWPPTARDLRLAPLGGERPTAVRPAGEGNGAATVTRTPHPDPLPAPRGEGKRLRWLARRRSFERPTYVIEDQAGRSPAVVPRGTPRRSSR